MNNKDTTPDWMTDDYVELNLNGGMGSWAGEVKRLRAKLNTFKSECETWKDAHEKAIKVQQQAHERLHKAEAELNQWKQRADSRLKLAEVYLTERNAAIRDRNLFADERETFRAELSQARAVLAERDAQLMDTIRERDNLRAAVAQGQKNFEAERNNLKADKDVAYTDRNRLVQALSFCFPSYLATHPKQDANWDPEWRWIVFIDLPTGQASWHIHDSQINWFSHLPAKPNNWDGHTVGQKHERIAELVKWGGMLRKENEDLKIKLAEHSSRLNPLWDLVGDIRDAANKLTTILSSGVK